MDSHDTIVAVSTATGPGLRGIVRLSGPKALEIAIQDFQGRDDGDSIVNGNRGSLPEPSSRLQSSWREGEIRIAGLRPSLPVSLALWREPRSYTGENLAEIHLSGSPPLVQLMLAHCLSQGARLAEPGEFTLRAFLRGRLDLTKAEAVFAVIHADRPDQLRQALEQLAGGLGGPIRELRDRLLDLLAHLEAGLDFVDEADVDPLARAELARELAVESRELHELAQRLQSRDRPALRPRVALHGRPNAGKSRLFNALAGESRALVSPIAGTTRDYLSAAVDCGQGWTIELIDVAGADDARDVIEDQAQDQRRDQIGQADLVIDCAAIDAEPITLAETPSHVIRVWTKRDLCPPDDATRLAVSAMHDEGIDDLKRAIREVLARQAGDPLAASGARCHDSIAQASAALGRASECLDWGGGDELVAIDVRFALDELGKVVGAIVTDDVLDRIFQRFCIGK